jgi:hypothetical protein
MHLKSKIIVVVTVLITTLACYGVYYFFESLREAEIAQREQRLQDREKAVRIAEQEVESKRITEAQRLVDLEKEKLRLEQERLNQEFLHKKKFADFKKHKKEAEEQRLINLRVQRARKLDSPEALTSKVEDGIDRATYLYIRNNPKEFIGRYAAGKGAINGRGVFTKGGANGLMLFATIGKNLKAIKEMIAIGHDVNEKNKSGHTALMFASAYNTAEVVQFFLDQGADILLKEYLTEGNALHLAARYNPKPEIIGVLVKAGFDLEAEDGKGDTPLLIAAKYNQNIQVVEKLVELGANVNATDSKGDVTYAYVLDRTKKRSHSGAYKKITDELEQKILDSLLPI